MDRLLSRPGSVLFACTMNRVRSPMAAALFGRRLGGSVFVDSCGVVGPQGESEAPDAFVWEVLAETGVVPPPRRPKGFDEVGPDQFDLIVCLTPEAAEAAAAAVRGRAVDLEVWSTFDPTLETGARLQRLEAYRRLRRDLEEKIAHRFPA